MRINQNEKYPSNVNITSSAKQIVIKLKISNHVKSFRKKLLSLWYSLFKSPIEFWYHVQHTIM